MTKIKTRDLFYKKRNINERVRFCSSIAKRYRLDTSIKYTNEGVELYLSGLKSDIVKYYIRTLHKGDCYINSIKKIIYVLL